MKKCFVEVIHHFQCHGVVLEFRAIVFFLGMMEQGLRISTSFEHGKTWLVGIDAHVAFLKWSQQSRQVGKAISCDLNRLIMWNRVLTQDELLRVMAEAGTLSLCEEKVDSVIEAMRKAGYLIRVK